MQNFILILTALTLLGCDQTEASFHRERSHEPKPETQDLTFQAAKSSAISPLQLVRRARKQTTLKTSGVPKLTPFRSSVDGRISVRSCPKNTGVGNLCFGILRPESHAIEKSKYHKLPAQSLRRVETTASRVNVLQAIGTHMRMPRPQMSFDFQHPVICDQTQDPNFNFLGKRYLYNPTQQPSACTNSHDDDCYKLSVLTVGKSLKNSSWRLFSVPVEVVVRKPKTAQAAIEMVRIDRTRRVTSSSFNTIREPTVTADGRLLIFHGAPTGRMFYSFNRKSPCDASGWSRSLELQTLHLEQRRFIANAKPFQRAPYGIGLYPMRDSVGRVAQGNLYGGYPWIDRAGTNLFFAGASSRWMKEELGSYRIVNASNASDASQRISALPRVGMSVIGLWTRGKTIVVDGPHAPADFTVGPIRSKFFFYRDGSATDLPQTGLTLFNSIENRFNYQKGFQPASKWADVAWHVAANDVHGEINFDDWTRDGAYIVSSMQSVISTQNGRTTFDGARLQNHATKLSQRIGSSRISLPAFGQLINAETMPIAEGGIRGKGLYFSGNSRATFNGSVQGNPGHHSWTTHLALQSKGKSQVLASINFPALSRLVVRNDMIVFIDRGKKWTVLKRQTLKRDTWYTVSLSYSKDTRMMRVFINGNLEGERFVPAHLAQILSAGTSTTTLSSQGDVWLDDFKVYLSDMNLEEVCNQSYGTLFASRNLNLPIRDFQLVNHYRNAPGIAENYRSFGCARLDPNTMREVTTFGGSCFQNTKTPESCIRESFTVQNLKLEHDVPRPNATANKFCTSCHSTENLGGLSIQALARRGHVNMHQDLRRQPSQNPPFLSGHPGLYDSSYGGVNANPRTGLINFDELFAP